MNKNQNGKKLELKKITIANLDKQEMNRLQAGGSPIGCVSTWLTTCCTEQNNG